MPGISPDGGLLIGSPSPLTPEQRTYIRAHKVLLLAELRAELAPVAEIAPVAESFPIEPVIPVMPVAPLDQDAFEERAEIPHISSRTDTLGRSQPATRQTAKPEPAQRPISITVAKPEPVCCGDCAHSVLPPDTCPVYGWRLCGLALEGGGGFARAERRCDAWATALPSGNALNELAR